MNVNLEKTFSFSCVLVESDAAPWINVYDVRIRMCPVTENHVEYNIAYERMKFWFQCIMQDSLMLQQDHDKLSIWRDTGIRCLDFPVPPVDQVLGLMLMSKLTAMVEGRINIREIAICSPADEFVWYVCDRGDQLHWFDQPGWWQESSPVHATMGKKTRNTGKIITIPRQEDWQTHDLEWNVAQVKTSNVSVLPTGDRDA